MRRDYRGAGKVSTMARTDLLGRLADLSEDAIQRLSDAPGAERVIGALNTMRDRLDELQKRVRGLEELEQRLTSLERKVDKLGKGIAAESGTGKTTSTKSSGTTSAKKS
jgi:hypothetical protein